MVIAAFGFTNTAKAQDINFGIKVGANFSNLNGADIDLDGRSSLHAGVVLELELMDKFALQPELIYSTQGAEIPDLAELKLDYLSLPILAKYYLVKGFSIEAGPQFSFLVNDATESLQDGVAVDDFEGESFDLGGVIGLGFKTPVGIFAQARYVIGLTAVEENPDIKNGVFQISLGYNF